MSAQGGNKGITVFAPTDGAFQASAGQLAALSDKDKAVVAMNHVSRPQPSAILLLCIIAPVVY